MASALESRHARRRQRRRKAGPPAPSETAVPRRAPPRRGRLASTLLLLCYCCGCGRVRAFPPPAPFRDGGRWTRDRRGRSGEAGGPRHPLASRAITEGPLHRPPPPPASATRLASSLETSCESSGEAPPPSSAPAAASPGRGRGSPSKKPRRPYARKLPPSPSERDAARRKRERHAAYSRLRAASLRRTNAPPSVWSFDSLFPTPRLDGESVREDLYGDRAREEEMRARQAELRAGQRRGAEGRAARPARTAERAEEEDGAERAAEEDGAEWTAAAEGAAAPAAPAAAAASPAPPPPAAKTPVDKTLTRLVEDRIYGLQRSLDGSGLRYSNSLLDSARAVQFRDGVRLGKALAINVDRLCDFAKKDLRKGRTEEAQEFYLEAVATDPTDGRPYLGLSRIAQRRGDLVHARGLLKEGIAKSSGGYVKVRGPKGTGSAKKGKKTGGAGANDGSNGKSTGGANADGDAEKEHYRPGATIGTIPDLGPNPFLLQALGTLEQKLGNLAAAEQLYLQAIRSRPSHAAAWVSLGQLRTKQLRQGAPAGRACYRSAERELARIGARPSSFVYTAWASCEYKKGGRGAEDKQSLRRARELYRKALDVDPRCSVAYLQLGVMEGDCGNGDAARECFERVLTFDQRNSRVLQAYAIMESRRVPREDVDARRVLELFERALKANPRDAGVYQAYALYVVELGDVDSARDLLRRGAKVHKRHAAVWQAWGVLETRYSTAKVARDVFQQGIWACAQPSGGQSGGRRCARLWQAWGVLEAQEGDHAAARRCFSRALDADPRNVAALTAWTLMEADAGNFADARCLFETALKLFRGSSADKTAIWRAYEVMEERAGHTREAQLVFRRSMGEAMASTGEESTPENPSTEAEDLFAESKTKASKRKEVEVSRWDIGSSELDSKVWMNNGSIEGKLPPSMMKKLKNRR